MGVTFGGNRQFTLSPTPIMPLNDATARTAKPREKPYKLSDEKGMYLLVNPNGSKWWRLKYRFAGKEKLLSLGVYPSVTLRMARAKRDGDSSLRPDGLPRQKQNEPKLVGARELIAMGIDPSVNRQAHKATVFGQAESSFEIVAREWHSKTSSKWSKGHGAKILKRLENDVFPWLGKRPIASITAQELLACLRKMETRGAIETAHRAHQNCSQVFRYAIATGRAERDVAADLQGALPPTTPVHHASITDPKAIGELLCDIEGYKGAAVTKAALRLAPLVFLRPGELRRAEWDELDFDKAEWRLPAEKMKSKVPHIVPLSKQALAILQEIKPLTGKGKYVFPSVRSNERAMSENTVNAALRRLGYTTEDMTGHGFRSMASTLLNEHGWDPDAIEKQLAHAERNTVRAAYNYAEKLPERRKMMKFWADHLDELANAARKRREHHRD